MNSHEQESEQVGLPLGVLDIAPTPDFIAGQIANSIFRPWFKEYYEGRYTQSTAFIMKVLKHAVLSCVVQGEDTEEAIREAMKHLGLKQQVVTEASLQYALSRAREVEKRRKNAGVWNQKPIDPNMEVLSDDDIRSSMFGDINEGEGKW